MFWIYCKFVDSEPNRPTWSSIDAITGHQWVTATATGVAMKAILVPHRPGDGPLPVGVPLLPRTARMRRYAQKVRLIDRVVPGVMARRTASSSGSSVIKPSPGFRAARLARRGRPWRVRPREELQRTLDSR